MAGGNMINTKIFYIAIVFYALGTFHYLLYLLYQRDLVSRVAYWMALSGFGVHTLFFVTRGFESGYFPITNMFESLTFFAWSIMLFFILYERKYHLPVMGSFVLPLTLVLMSGAFTTEKDIVPLIPALQSRWLYTHATFAFLGYAAFVITFAGGVMYLIQERQLKTKNPGAFYYRLPSLNVLDRINYHSLTIGFSLLTLGIITGAVWAEVAWGSYWSWDPKETWSLITWFIYAALLHVRLTVGWRGRKAAYLAILGFAAVLFTFLGVNLLGGLHSYT
jgi:cytochrome c-type biogenesis protein CcsB